MAVATVGVVCVVTVAIGLVSGRSVHATAHPGASAAHAAGSIRRFDSNGPGARKVSPGEMSAWSVLMKRLSHGDVRKPRDCVCGGHSQGVAAPSAARPTDRPTA